MSSDHVSLPPMQCTNVTFPFCTGVVHVVVLGIPVVVAVTGCVPALLAVLATPSPTTARTARANDARRNLIRVLSSGLPTPTGAGVVPQQRGKKDYASIKATCRVAFLKTRFARLDPLTFVTQPGSVTLVNIVTNRKRDDLVSARPPGPPAPRFAGSSRCRAKRPRHCRAFSDRPRYAAFFVASLPVPLHSGHSSTRRSSYMGPGT